MFFRFMSSLGRDDMQIEDFRRRLYILAPSYNIYICICVPSARRVDIMVPVLMGSVA